MPAWLVTTVRDAPVLVFLTVTVTPGRTPPVESLVTPVMVPVVSCADATTHVAAISSIITPSLRLRELLRCRSLSSWNKEDTKGTKDLLCVLIPGRNLRNQNDLAGGAG